MRRPWSACSASSDARAGSAANWASTSATASVASSSSSAQRCRASLTVASAAASSSTPVGGAHAVEQQDVRRGLVDPVLLLGGPPEQLVEAWPFGREPPGQRRQLVDASRGRRPRLGGRPGQALELAGDDVGPVARDRRPLPGRAGHAVVQAQVEQAYEQVLPLAGLGVEELGELALGQRHARGEVVEAEPDHRLDRGRDLLGVAGEHLGASLEARLLGGGAPPWWPAPPVPPCTPGRRR